MLKWYILQACCIIAGERTNKQRKRTRRRYSSILWEHQPKKTCRNFIRKWVKMYNSAVRLPIFIPLLQSFNVCARLYCGILLVALDVALAKRGVVCLCLTQNSKTQYMGLETIHWIYICVKNTHSVKRALMTCTNSPCGSCETPCNVVDFRFLALYFTDAIMLPLISRCGQCCCWQVVMFH